MKNNTAIIVAMCAILGIYSFGKISLTEIGIKEAYKGSHLYQLFTSGAPAGRTGAPGETNCTSCHSGTVADGTAINTLSMFETGTGNLVTQYELGKTYDVVLNIVGTTTKRGFQTTARAISTNLTAGSLSAVANSTALLSSGGNEFINHLSASVSSSDFSFKWTAPASNEGDIRFYVASNVTNASGTNSGDQIFLSQHTFSKKIVLPVASFTSTNASICAGNSISFTSTSTGNPTAYSWTFAGGSPNISSDPNPVISYATAGTYDVTLNVTNADGSNQIVQTSFITINEIPAITLANSTNPSTCSAGDGSIQIGGSATGIVSWTGASSGNSGNTTLPFLIPNLAAGSYTVSFLSSLGCNSNAISHSLSDPGGPSAPTVTSSDANNQICAGENIVLTSSANTGNSWSTGETTSSITVTSSGNYSVQVVSGGCTSASSTPIIVTVNPIPVTPSVSSSDADNIICLGTESLTLTSSTASAYLWSTGESTQQITVNASGNYSLNTIENGCNSLPSVVTAVTAQNCASLDENTLDLILIYPNPSSNQLLIKGADLSKMKVITCVDQQGKIVEKWTIDQMNEIELDLSKIKSGNYQFILQDGNNLRIERLITVLQSN